MIAPNTFAPFQVTTAREHSRNCHRLRSQVAAYCEGFKRGLADLDAVTWDYATLDIAAKEATAYAKRLERDEHPYDDIMRAYGRAAAYYMNGAR